MDDLPALPERPDDGHKNRFGTVVVIGGQAAMPGAPALVASAALRIGAGQVRLAVPADILATVVGLQPSATGLPWEDDPIPALESAAAQHGDHPWVAAIGPGLDPAVGGAPLLDALQRTAPDATVLDAGALRLLANHPRQLDERVVLTPHPGEYRALAEAFGVQDGDPTGSFSARRQAAGGLAASCGCVVLLKGPGCVIAHPDGSSRDAGNANPALATAGSGDVLTGLVAGLLAQGQSPLDAAHLASALHTTIAEHWRERFGPRGLLAWDMIQRIPAAVAGHADMDP